MIPEDLKYSESHEWAKVEGDVVTIGISQHAVEQLQDLVYIEINEVGEEVEQGENAGVIESVKIAADLNSPVTGEIAEINSAVVDNVETLSANPYEEGWLFKVKISDTAQLDKLLDAKAYSELVEKELAEGH